MHISDELAIDLIEGKTESAEMKALIEHIDQCSSCNELMEQWRRMHSVLKRSHLESAPPEYLERARAIFDVPPTPKWTGIREVVATVVFDSLTQPAFAGARGATAAQHVVLRAEEFDIHLKISLDPSVRQMVGQVFARDETEFLTSVRLQLLQNGTPLKTTWTDNFGEFRFDEVPQGVLRLQVDLPRLTVVGGITIGERGESGQ
jgi:hypothetical protein